MPAFLTGLFSSLATWFGQWFTKKVAMVAAAGATFVALTLAFWGVMVAAIAALSYSMPSWLSSGIGQVIPGNLSACVSALVAARLARAVYDWHVENLKIMSYIT